MSSSLSEPNELLVGLLQNSAGVGSVDPCVMGIKNSGIDGIHPGVEAHWSGVDANDGSICCWKVVG
jgi:hypothetical protein